MSNRGQRKSPQLTLVLLGESGSGKSASGNTILGENDFISKPSSMPVTIECEKKEKSICGIKVTVIDTPDFFDDCLQEKNRQIQIQSCRNMCDGVLCVYLLVIQTGRFTEGERDILERLEKALQTSVRERAIILFTRGEDLGTETEIDDYFRDSTPFLQQLIKDCGGRYQVFNNSPSLIKQVSEKCGKMLQWLNNSTSHQTEAEKQVKELMRKIVKLVPECEAERSGCV